ncbi:DnaT-like ssDNA-binding protein [Xenophilus sp. Marseille-Q4582]|uniref:DnaT-like ssDNA-binding protein n=1 Tax=Xenophilus sp. Marseille-Q4582 TaxID=2866600 RepID=UPI001CE474DE|nr:DnaT-like ssDNA-binding protein [Xenophilus sp. Marseille-Q4582]
MALIVAPAEGFDSLVSVVQADAYCAAMGHAGWTGTDEVKEAALRRATLFLLTNYNIRGEYLYVVHKRVQDACCEAGLRALTGSLFTDVAAAVATEKTVGPVTVKYAEALRNGGQVRFTIIDNLLRGLTDGGFGQIRLVRA